MNDGPVIDVEAGLRAVKLTARDPVRRRRAARLARRETGLVGRLARTSDRRPRGPVLAPSRAASGAVAAGATSGVWAAGAAASAVLVYLWWRRRSGARV